MVHFIMIQHYMGGILGDGVGKSQVGLDEGIEVYGGG